MTLREEVAQLVFPWISGAYASPSSPEFEDVLDQIELGVGGVLISIGLPHSYAAKLNELQRRADVPLLVSSDFEQGGPGMRLAQIFALPSLLDQGGGTSFPPTMGIGAVGEEELAREVGRITAVEARAVGVHLNFAPVLDVNSNPRNPVINTRSFGEDPLEVGRLGAAFIRGSRHGGVLTTAKHFPGHGDTETDSHIALPAVPADRARLDTLELVPFRYALDAGVDAVMTAHVVVPGVLGPDSPPATLSAHFLTGLLRGEMGFDGLILTDALRMGAITQGWGGGEAAVRALEAGSDVLLAPADVEESLAAVVAAVESGRLSRERIRESVRRILELKVRVGLHEGRVVDLEAVDRIVGAGPHLDLADSVAARSMTLVRDVDHLVPLLPDSVERVLSLTWTRPGDPVGSRTADGLLADRFEGLRVVGLSAADGPGALDALWNSAWEADRVLVNSFIAYQAGTGIIGVEKEFARFVRRLAVHRPVVATSFGNPYALDAFPEVGSYLLAWGERDVSQRAAVRALTGEARISGTLPISLPPYHFEGEGLVRERAVEARDEGPRDQLDETGFVAGQDERETEEVADSAAADPSARDSAVADSVVGDSRSGPVLPSMTVSRSEAAASDAGMSDAVLARLDTALLEAVADSATPGAALVLGRGDRLVRLRGYGRSDWDPDAPPATPTTLYDLASLTKVIATTAALMRLVDEGRLSLEDRVVQHLPWWAEGDSRKADVTLRQLLLHRSGLPEYEPLFTDARGRADYERAIGGLELEFDPGTRSQYSDVGMMTLGFVVEEVTDRPLGEHVDETVWTPLGMTDTGFLPEDRLLPRIAPTEVDATLRDSHLHGVVHDENAWALGGRAGHAGVFSTAAD
ncbi:MAG: glycoside hydrolase family 3 N-terminal domain-containing protein, partial [Gemmatimonadota bacterium]